MALIELQELKESWVDLQTNMQNLGVLYNEGYITYDVLNDYQGRLEQLTPGDYKLEQYYNDIVDTCTKLVGKIEAIDNLGSTIKEYKELQESLNLSSERIMKMTEKEVEIFIPKNVRGVYSAKLDRARRILMPKIKEAMGITTLELDEVLKEHGELENRIAKLKADYMKALDDKLKECLPLKTKIEPIRIEVKRIVDSKREIRNKEREDKIHRHA